LLSYFNIDWKNDEWTPAGIMNANKSLGKEEAGSIIK
jgi:hypothetical protein